MKYMLTALLILVGTNADAMRRDHQMHFGAGAIMYPVMRVAGLTPGEALTGCVTVGILKEARDALGYGTPEISDVVFTALPCALMAGAEWLAGRGQGGHLRSVPYRPTGYIGERPVSRSERRELIRFGNELARR